MLWTSSARFMELEARLSTRQQTEFDRKDKISSERLSQIENRLHRFDEVDSKLDNLKAIYIPAMQYSLPSLVIDGEALSTV
jgi:hypothetical protein